MATTINKGECPLVKQGRLHLVDRPPILTAPPDAAWKLEPLPIAVWFQEMQFEIEAPRIQCGLVLLLRNTRSVRGWLYWVVNDPNIPPLDEQVERDIRKDMTYAQDRGWVVRLEFQPRLVTFRQAHATGLLHLEKVCRHALWDHLVRHGWKVERAGPELVVPRRKK